MINVRYRRRFPTARGRKIIIIIIIICVSRVVVEEYIASADYIIRNAPTKLSKITIPSRETIDKTFLYHTYVIR